MTLNAHAIEEATVNLFRRKRQGGRGGLWAISPLRRAFRHRSHAPADTPFGLRSGEAGLELPELFGGNSGPGDLLFAEGGALVEEPLRSGARLAAALDDEDEDEEEDIDDDDLDEEDDDLEAEDDEEEDLDDEDEDGLDEDEDEDEYLDDEDEEDDEEEE